MHIAALILGLAVGVVAIVVGITQKVPALFIFAVLAFFGSITGYIYGKGSVKAEKDPKGLTAIFKYLPNWVIAVDAVLLIATVIVAFVT